MSTSNGSAPEGTPKKARMLTVDLIEQHTTLTHRCARLSEILGEDVTLTLRWVGREEYLILAPPNPPGSTEWKQEEYARRFADWYRSLTEADLVHREKLALDLLYRVVSLASIDPVLTFEQARKLGSDGEEAAVAVLLASGIYKRKETPATDTPAAPEAAEQLEPQAIAA